MTEEKQNNTKFMPSDTQVIVTTAIKTLYACVVILALFAVLFVSLFPYSAMKLYDGLGNTHRAYASARRAVRVESGEERVSAMLASVNYGASLFEEEPDAHALYLYEDTLAFLSDGSCIARAEKVDEYNLAHSAKKLHPNLYSYLSYARELNARSAYRIGKTDTVKENLSKFYEVTDLTECAFRLSEASAVFSEVAETDKKIDFIEVRPLAIEAKTYLHRVLSSLGGEITLNQLYCVKAYEKFVSRLALTEKEIADEIKTVIFAGSEIDITTLYTQLLNDYSK